jgi:cell shape-determining protein MreC
VSRHSATVVLLTDPTFAVGVRLPGTNVGTAQGSGRGQPLRVTIDTTDIAAPVVRVGQVVVTSGLNLEKFPPYIPVGRISSVTTPPGSAEPEITIKPIADLATSYVQVMLWSPQ